MGARGRGRGLGDGVRGPGTGQPLPRPFPGASPRRGRPAQTKRRPWNHTVQPGPPGPHLPTTHTGSGGRDLLPHGGRLIPGLRGVPLRRGRRELLGSALLPTGGGGGPGPLLVLPSWGGSSWGLVLGCCAAWRPSCRGCPCSPSGLALRTPSARWLAGGPALLSGALGRGCILDPRVRQRLEATRRGEGGGQGLQPFRNGRLFVLFLLLLPFALDRKRDAGFTFQVHSTLTTFPPSPLSCSRTSSVARPAPDT